MPEESLIPEPINIEIESFNKELAKSIHENLDTSFNNFQFDQFLKLVVAVVIFSLVSRLCWWMINKLKSTLCPENTLLSPLKFKQLVFLDSSSFKKLIDLVFVLLKLTAALFLAYSFLTYVLSIFPQTKGVADTLISYFMSLGATFFKAFLGFIPNMLTISFIVFLTYYLLEFVKFLARSLFAQKISFSGFKQEWILPTYKIAQFFIVIFAIIAIFPYLPGSDSPAFKGVSVFVGLLITLGSSTAIANTIAGLVLIYMSPYNIGDRVKIDHLVGDITEIGLLVTRIRTVKNEDVTIPNSKILSHETINYTDSTQSRKPLLLYVKITVGYDVPWRKVESLLTKSASGIEGVPVEEKAFVLVDSLDNNYISYELNVPVKEASKMLNIKSSLNKNILDNFNEAGVEILSPAYYSLRDGTRKTVVKEDA